jgi:hypothetical protein
VLEKIQAKIPRKGQWRMTDGGKII